LNIRHETAESHASNSGRIAGHAGRISARATAGGQVHARPIEGYVDPREPFRDEGPLPHDLMGWITLVFWSRAKAWGEGERMRTANRKFFECCEWLADRIAERRAQLGHESAQVRHTSWRE
jgi:hypothetical protein